MTQGGGAWGAEVRPYHSPVPCARTCWGRWHCPGERVGSGGVPGAVGTRGGVGAPPTAY